MVEYLLRPGQAKELVQALSAAELTLQKARASSARVAEEMEQARSSAQDVAATDALAAIEDGVQMMAAAKLSHVRCNAVSRRFD